MALFTRVQTVGRVVSLPIEAVDPNPAQPRRRFEPQALRALADSINENGLLQPITVRKKPGGRYELIAGERRLQASKLAGRWEIAAIVVEADDKQSATLALLENLQRSDLSVFEQAEGFAALLCEHGYTQESLARQMGMAQSTLANKLRLLKLGGEERRLLEENDLTERHARALLRVEEPERLEVLQLILARGWNVEQTEQYIDNLLVEKAEPRQQRRQVVMKDARMFINTIDKTVEAIKRMGIALEAQQRCGDSYVEYILRVPIETGAEKQAEPAELQA